MDAQHVDVAGGAVHTALVPVFTIGPMHRDRSDDPPAALGDVALDVAVAADAITHVAHAGIGEIELPLRITHLLHPPRRIVNDREHGVEVGGGCPAHRGVVAQSPVD